MRYLLIGKQSLRPSISLPYLIRYSYEIATDAPDWADAEKQVERTLTKKKNKANGVDDNVTVSVRSANKTGSKRKGETAEQVYQEEIGSKEEKKLKKMKKSKS
jgi:N-acetyltransferase 10